MKDDIEVVSLLDAIKASRALTDRLGLNASTVIDEAIIHCATIIKYGVQSGLDKAVIPFGLTKKDIEFLLQFAVDGNMAGYCTGDCEEVDASIERIYESWDAIKPA